MTQCKCVLKRRVCLTRVQEHWEVRDGQRSRWSISSSAVQSVTWLSYQVVVDFFSHSRRELQLHRFSLSLSLTLPLWRMALNTLSLSLSLCRSSHRLGQRSLVCVIKWIHCINITFSDPHSSQSRLLWQHSKKKKKKKEKKRERQNSQTKVTLVFYQSSYDGAFKRKETKRSELNVSAFSSPSSWVHIHSVI